ncbi:hypothetical protein Tco_1054928 [Tanacetum coccineum]|uniref:Uncharacterized protein n=1 Tax=Tanacetum coccineum TaxID=301880 RepID=A0ABQ5GY70_9ASTR
MLNPNQDTGVDAIFRYNAEAILVDLSVTAIAEPSFLHQTNRPPTPTHLFTQLQQPPILTPTTTPSSLLQNLPNFGSLFGFHNRLKALEDNFSEFKQINQYAEAFFHSGMLTNTYGDKVTLKRPRDGADDDQEPSARIDRGSKRKRSGKEPDISSAPREKDNHDSRQDIGSVHDEQTEEEVHLFPDWFQQPKRLPSPDHAWNKSVPAVHESVNLASNSEVLQSHNRKNWTGSTTKDRQSPMIAISHLPLVPNSQVDIEKVFTMKMEILLEPTSNKLMVDPHGIEGYQPKLISATLISNVFLEGRKYFRYESQERCSIKVFQDKHSTKGYEFAGSEITNPKMEQSSDGEEIVLG